MSAWGINGPPNLHRELLERVGDLLVGLRNTGKSHHELGDGFAELLPQITRMLGGWTATRSIAQDDAEIFLGSVGHALVIDPRGRIWRGVAEYTAAHDGGPAGVTFQGLVLVADYRNLRGWR